MIINVDQHLKLELLTPDHAAVLFELIDKNRDKLRVWLSFIDRMPTIEAVELYINYTQQRNSLQQDFAFLIFEDDQPVGRIGVYQINNQNQHGEIGYWLIPSQRGRGIMKKSCRALIHFCFSSLPINRLAIKCGTGNYKSQAIPEKLNFTKEGTLREGKYLNNQFIDLYLYSLLKRDFLEK
jgi:ribosomal-protein-serine acetyltransferase